MSTAGDLLAGIAQDVSRLVRLEIELAKQEIVELAKPKALAHGLGALGVVLALSIVPFILLTLFELFARLDASVGGGAADDGPGRGHLRTWFSSWRNKKIEGDSCPSARSPA